MAEAESSQKSDHLAQVRDSVESVYVAIVLAFVLRAFMVEAFVIPTGSMANSLYGDHYELTCPSCGWRYAYGRDGRNTPGLARCPNCYFRYGNASHADRSIEPKGGDRVLVLKYLYDFSSPQPWDVVVFKNPQNNRENYIKRLIGLPGEGIRILHGDIFVSRDGGKSWRIRRKTPQAQRAMWQVVYDGDYPPSPLVSKEQDVPSPRWQPARKTSSRWDLKKGNGRVLAFAGDERAEAIRFDPGYGAFRPFNGYNDAETRSLGYDPQNDICTDWNFSCVWCVESDKPSVLEAVFTCQEDHFRAVWESGGTVRLLHRRRDAAEDSWEEWGRASVGSFLPNRGRQIALTNVDYCVEVWVDNRRVLQSTDEQYAGPSRSGRDRPAAERIFRKAWSRATLRERKRQCERDIQAAEARLQQGVIRSDHRAMLQEAVQREKRRLRVLEQREKWFDSPGILVSARGGPAALWHVKVHRDVFYTQSRLRDPSRYVSAQTDPDSPVYEYFHRLAAKQKRGQASAGGLKPLDGGDFAAWGSQNNPIFLKDYPGRDDRDEFFCLGDNSSQSHDGRSWEAAAPSLRLYDENGLPIYQLGTVPRYNILGRAMLVYWPAGFRLPILDWPLVPNVGKMRLIR